MAGTRVKREYSFHISQDELSQLPIIAPLSIKQEAYLNDDSDIVFFGGSAGSGKSHLSLIQMLIGGLTDSNYVAGIFRKSQRQVKQAGGLWETGCRMYRQYGIVSNQLDMSWRFQNGAFIKSHHLQGNTDDLQGMQCTEFLCDEVTQMEEDDVVYLLSRLRSQSKRKHQLRMTGNPSKDSFMCEWLEKAGYLDEEGYPKPEMDGKKTWMLQIQGSIEFFKERSDIRDKYGRDAERNAQSFTFHAADVYSNPFIRKYQPDYVFKLENMNRVERERLLLGCWYASEESLGFIKRDMIEEINPGKVPLGLPQARGWDLAGTLPSEAYPNPDYTIGVKMSYDRDDGTVYITDLIRMRDRAANVERTMLRAARDDGKDVYQVIPQDPGAAGKQVAQTKKSRLMREGSRVLLSNTRGSKLSRAENFIMAVQAGQVKVSKGVFDKLSWIELEAFDGNRNAYHDDLIDALADAYNALATGKLIPTFSGLAQNKSRLSAIGGSTLL